MGMTAHKLEFSASGGCFYFYFAFYFYLVMSAAQLPGSGKRCLISALY
jgi:hypothetical protein